MKEINMQKKQQSIRTFDRLSASYSESEYAQRHAGWDSFLLPLVLDAQPASVLDVGCGTGEFLERLIRKSDARAAGLDISAGMIREARSRLGSKGSVDLREGDAEALPWPDASFDAIICIASFHHYPNSAQALAEMHRVLTPHGTIFLADVFMPTPVRQMTNALLPFLRDGDVHMYSESEIHHLGQATGFIKAQWQTIPNGGFLCVLEKS
jgi:ubiquinone/menaquinone biosynthesis C-methylase UbiE